MKLWSYGDSHAAGYELGTNYSKDMGKSWFCSVGYEDRNEARNQLGVDKYNKLIKQKWYQEINHLCTPSLSYAGHLAKLLDYELVDRASPGSSNSLNMLKIYQDLSKWNNDDVILFSIVTPFRFIPGKDIDSGNHQVHCLPKNIAKVLWEDGPHEVCFRLQTHGYLHMAKNLHKNVYTLQTVPDDISVEGITPAFDIQLSFTEFVKTNYDIESLRYPGGHLHEDVHVSYAEYIYNTWNR